ncbi:MAG: antitoxin VbhA family protein [Actinobacteria bacterium]|nr:antitoxin VbhA family protein [Actinomycetota bacterium]
MSGASNKPSIAARWRGFSVDPDTLADSDDYIAGVIDSDELIARARARYGLD